MRYKKFFLFVFFISCSHLDFKEPKIIESYPQDNTVGVANNASPWVIFSESMDIALTESATSLGSSKGKVAGEFLWQGNRLIYQPKSELQSGEKYSFFVSQKAEDINGNNLSQDFQVDFIVNTDSTKPELLSTTPTHGEQGVLPSDKLVFVFSEAVDTTSLISGIKISPAITGEFQINSSGETVTFVPYNEMSYGTIYTINVSEAVRDLAGNPLREKKNYSFIVGNDFVRPSIKSVDASGISLISGILSEEVSKSSSFIFAFSELMNKQKTIDAVSFSPFAQFSSTFTNSGTLPNQYTVMTIKPIEPLKSDTIYQLNVKTSAMDLFNNMLDQNYQYKFKTNAPDSTLPTVLGIRQQLVRDGVCTKDLNKSCKYGSCLSKGVCQRTESETISTKSTFPLSPEFFSHNKSVKIQHQLDIAPSLDSDTGDDLRLVLNVYFDKAMDITSLLSSVSLSVIASTANSPVISKMELVKAEKVLKIYFYKMIDGTGYYKLVIKGGVTKDKDGNPLKQDYILFFYT